MKETLGLRVNFTLPPFIIDLMKLWTSWSLRLPGRHGRHGRPYDRRGPPGWCSSSRRRRTRSNKHTVVLPYEWSASQKSGRPRKPVVGSVSVLSPCSLSVIFLPFLYLRCEFFFLFVYTFMGGWRLFLCFDLVLVSSTNVTCEEYYFV